MYLFLYTYMAIHHIDFQNMIFFQHNIKMLQEKNDFFKLLSTALYSIIFLFLMQNHFLSQHFLHCIVSDMQYIVL